MPAENKPEPETDPDKPEPENKPTTETPPPPKETETVDWKAKAREWEKRAKANADAATKLEALEESQKTEAQKLADKATAAEQRANLAEQNNLRYKVAVAKKLPAELVDRLRGDTEEEMSADADSLLALIKAEPQKPKPDDSQGPRPDAKPSVAAGRDMFADRHPAKTAT